MTASPKIFSLGEHLLETEDGRQAHLDINNQMHVIDVHHKNQTTKIMVYKYEFIDPFPKNPEDSKTFQMAFRFEIDNASLFLTAEKEDLKFAQPAKTPKPGEDTQFFFKWGEESGEARRLVSIATSKYLSCSGGRVVISSKEDLMPTLFKLI